MKTRCPSVAEFAQVNDVLDVTLAFVVARMGLAGEDKLDRAAACLAPASRCFRIAEKSAGHVCTCEAARKADRQRIGIEQLDRTQ
jgi:hypothetical protein